MELHAEEVGFADRRGHRSSMVVGGRQTMLGVDWSCRKRVDKVARFAGRDVLEDRAAPLLSRRLNERVPPYVGNFVRAAVCRGFGYRRDPTGNETESAMLAEFFTVFEHDLHAHTDAQQRSSGCRIAQQG